MQWMYVTPEGGSCLLISTQKLDSKYVFLICYFFPPPQTQAPKFYSGMTNIKNAKEFECQRSSEIVAPGTHISNRREIHRYVGEICYSPRETCISISYLKSSNIKRVIEPFVQRSYPNIVISCAIYSELTPSVLLLQLAL